MNVSTPLGEVLVSYSRTYGACRWCVPENTFRASRHVENLKPASQAEALGQVKRLFFPHRKSGCAFSWLSVQCPGVGSQPRAVSLIVSVGWESGRKTPTGASRRVPCVVHACSLALVKQLENTGLGTAPTLAGRGDCKDYIHLPALAALTR